MWMWIAMAIIQQVAHGGLSEYVDDELGQFGADHVRRWLQQLVTLWSAYLRLCLMLVVIPIDALFRHWQCLR